MISFESARIDVVCLSALPARAIRSKAQSHVQGAWIQVYMKSSVWKGADASEQTSMRAHRVSERDERGGEGGRLDSESDEGSDRREKDRNENKKDRQKG